MDISEVEIGDKMRLLDDPAQEGIVVGKTSKLVKVQFTEQAKWVLPKRLSLIEKSPSAEIARLRAVAAVRNAQLRKLFRNGRPEP